MHSDERIKQITNWLGNGSINIFGRPFSGKDCQSKILADLLSGNMLGAGEIFRGDDMPERIKECMKNGQLVDSDDFTNLILNRLDQPKFVGKPLILNSIGRWHGEEESVLAAAQNSGHSTKAVIYLKMSDNDIYKRLQKLNEIGDRTGRIDDSKDIMKTRIDEFQQKTEPVIDYYKKNGLLTEIDGKNPIEQVTNDILDVLHKIATY
ncbi:MAG: nucleoside monophosphate kinase [Candidatus Saccharibacteria bacterium]